MSYVRGVSDDAVARAVGLAVGVLADRAFADPAHLHPVAGMGIAAGRIERVLYRDTRQSGVLFTGVCVGATVVVSRVFGRCGAPGTAVVTAAATWAVLGGTSLLGVGTDLGAALRRGDLDAARACIPSLCGRDPMSLDESGMIRAAIESVAENTSDATVAPLVWGAVAGVPGLLGYRVVNTLDAMVGHRSQRYLRFGWASARLDDVANYVPARITGLTVAAVGPGRRDALRAWRRDAHRHPSPNAGVVEASFAGSLGIGLGGVTVYPYGVQDRPRLGDGRAPVLDDLDRTVALSRRVQGFTAIVSVAGALGIGAVRSRVARSRGSTK